MDNHSLLLETFCQQHTLPDTYADLAKRWFLPLAEELAQKQQQASKPILIGINGSQGSGKSTLSDLLKTLLTDQYGISVITLSIDDFYYTRQERTTLANTTHPLLITRGVPGTHDIPLLAETINLLSDTLSNTTDDTQQTVAIPRFDKAIDDRKAKHLWDKVNSPVDIILLEGWCVGTSAVDDKSLDLPINGLEEKEDSDAKWRRYSNQQLSNEYAKLFERLETLIFLQAPSFNCVYQWRKKQEDKLRMEHQKRNSQDTDGLMSDEQLQRFIDHYQRYTEHNLRELPKRADIAFTLNDNHEITQRYDN